MMPDPIVFRNMKPGFVAALASLAMAGTTPILSALVIRLGLYFRSGAIAPGSTALINIKAASRPRRAVTSSRKASHCGAVGAGEEWVDASLG